MMLLSFSDYLPLADLVKIVAVVLVAAFMAPEEVSLGVVGLDRRHAGAEGSGTAMVATGVAVIVVLVGVGLYALVHK
jgi:hypothetical protein